MKYTLFEAATGQIIGDGDCADPSGFEAEGVTVHLGERYSCDTHAFDLGTGLPFEKTSKDQDELRRDIHRERDRRIVDGKAFGGIWVTGRDQDITNLTNLALGAQLRLTGGDNITVITFRDGNNVDHDLVPSQVLDLWMAASAQVSAIYAASWALKAMDPIPQDITNDQYWPS